MSNGPRDDPGWERPRHTATASRAFLFFVVFGEVELSRPMSAKRYRCAAVPAEFELTQVNRARDAEYINSFRTGYVWDELVRAAPAFAETIQRASSCTVLRAEIPDPPTLTYLRDAVGLVTYLLDCGGVAVYDLQIFKWWQPDEWRSDVFEPARPAIFRQVVILTSDEPGAGFVWVHTRGMRKFARPDISVRRVPQARLADVVEMCNRFIEFQALGGVIAEGEEVRMRRLPPGGRARHGGDLEDPDFNNVHVDIVWPDGDDFQPLSQGGQSSV